MQENSSRREPAVWQLRSTKLTFDDGPLVMGILNVTPNSFSDGGQFHHVDRAVEQALKMEEDGAAIIDIGGESTQPYAPIVSLEDEKNRVEPVLRALENRLTIPISIDTSKSEVATLAIDLGAEIINDVTGLTGDPRMEKLAERTKVGVCVMHMQGNPRTMQDAPTYDNVVHDIQRYLAQRIAHLEMIGIDPLAICIDPGIGFGKDFDHNFELLANVASFIELGNAVMIGHSRKGMIAKAIGSKERPRLGGTIGIAVNVAAQGAHVIRVHDVGPVRDAILLSGLINRYAEN